MLYGGVFMKKFILCLMMASLFTIGLSVTYAERCSWRTIKSIPIEHSVHVAGFLNECFGLTGGFAGATYNTADGGETWTQAKQATSLCRYGMEIINANDAYLNGVGGLWRSNDGGLTWGKMSGWNEEGMYLSFSTAKTGWVASPDFMAVTTDGGESFTDVNFPQDASRIAAISALSATECFLLDDSGKLFFTKDMGVKWTQIESSLKGKLVLGRAPMSAMRFTSSGKGTVVTWSRQKKAWLVSKTTDYGVTWTSEDVKAAYGVVYLSKDAKLLTIYSNKEITVLQHDK
jgi:photosystem II stability/assembly factor-like uncharacterized protein